MTQTTPFSTNSSLPLPDVFTASLVSIFDAAKPAIVQVRTEGRGGGTGFLIDEDGRLLTNNHVVARDDAKVEVLLADGRHFPAVVLQRNPRLDLALLKIEGDELKTLSLGDSTKLRVGEWVFAVGHPWGQRWVVTAGIMSAMRTAKLGDDVTTHYIQSDVGLAPGNSGGPLLNADGQVVGINAMIFGGDLSVAIPSSVVKGWLAELPARRVTLGIEILTTELPTSLRSVAAQASGIMVVGIRQERQARYSDLFIGDILLEVAGKTVKDNAALLETLATSHESERLAVKLLRGGAIVEMEIATLLLERKK